MNRLKSIIKWLFEDSLFVETYASPCTASYDVFVSRIEGFFILSTLWKTTKYKDVPIDVFIEWKSDKGNQLEVYKDNTFGLRR